tara:strand:- start:1006 stop:1302 length:297 start_codon:yes stop_codon:yes gene_type:complete
MSGTFTHFEAAPEIIDQLSKLREDNIRRPWHGNDCVCEECTYTEEEHAHNRAISDKCRDVILSRKVDTIKKNTLKECKRIIDERESSLKLLNTTKESA